MFLRSTRTMHVIVLVLCACVVLTLLSVYELRQLQRQHFSSDHSGGGAAPAAAAAASDRPAVWVRGKHVHSGYLDHVFAVFDRLGYARSEDGARWDVLWNHDYPFLDDKLRPVLSALDSHQKVNHVPGSGFYTSKVNLATSNISGIPPAFSLPKQRDKFVAFAKSHADTLWVQKSNKHRGVKITKVDQLDLSQAESFIQEYIGNPLLIDGRKFDIGIYTVVTSTLPLRVYVYEGDALLRFCPADYHPFDAANLDKYVVGDDYTPTWQIPSLSKYYTDQQTTFKEALNAYLRARGKEPKRMWTAIHETIRQTFLAKAADMQPLVRKYKYPWNFFELSRFDFVLDEDLNVYLMEANMSPNLSSGHFPANKLLYEQVVFNMLSLVGVARAVHSDSLRSRGTDEQQMVVSERDVQVFADRCESAECAACPAAVLVCQLCRKCASVETRAALRHAYTEHVARRNMRRVLPAPLPAPARARRTAPPPTDEDVLMALWFEGKCAQDPTWCA